MESDISPVIQALHNSSIEENDAEPNDIETCIKEGDLDKLTAQLKLPPESVGGNVFRDTSQVTLLRERFTKQPHKDCDNLLSFAVKYGNNEALEFLIKQLELNITPLKYKTALQITQLALTNDKKLQILLDNDFPVPDNNDFQLTDQLKEIQLERKDFSDAIEVGNLDGVKMFVNKYPNIKVGYLQNGMSALNYALKCQKYEIYAFLLCSRFTANDNDKYLNSIQLTNGQKRSILGMCSRFYDRPVDSHIVFIWSRLRKIESRHDFEKIKTFLEQLNAIPEIKPILEVIEYSPSLMIVFDFDRKDISKIDFPSQPEFGSCYHHLGHLYIAGNRSDEAVMGTLIHELCHYAMEIVFDNQCKPFAASDSNNKKHFDDIVENYRHQEHAELIMRRVFLHYEENSFAKELIVRVPELLVAYQGDKLKEIKTRYEELFSFYMENVLPKIRQDSSNLQLRRDVRETNQILGHYRNYITDARNAISENSETLKILAKHPQSIQVIVSDIPQYSVATLIKHLKYPIVLTIQDLIDERMRIDAMCYRSGEIDLVVNCQGVSEIPVKVIGFLKGKRIPGSIFLVCDEKSMKEQILDWMMLDGVNSSEIFHSNVNYHWNDLANKKHFEKSYVQFQEHEVRLNKVTKLTADLTDLLPIAKLVKGTFKIGQAIPASTGYEYYVERSFSQVEKRNDVEVKKMSVPDTANLIQQSQTARLVLLIDKAGMGKSTSTTHIATMLKEKEKNLWIIRVDLSKDASFEKMKSGKANSLVETIAKLAGIENITCSFEGRLFEKIYSAGKVVVIFDGLDEILPFLEEKFFGLLPHIIASPIRQIWIATRPHVEMVSRVGESVEVVTWNIDPFTQDDFLNFVIKIWSNTLPQAKENFSKLKELAQDLCNFVQKNISSNSLELIGIPLQAKMLADIFKDQVKRIVNSECDEKTFNFSHDFDLLDLYETHFATLMQIVSKEKNKLLGIERTKLDMKRINMLEQYENIAHILIENETKDDSDSIVDEKTAIGQIVAQLRIQSNDQDDGVQRLQRNGIITYDVSNEKYYFIHRTYLEYFFSRFISRVLIEPKLDLIQKIFLIFGKIHTDVILQFLDGSLKREERIDFSVHVQLMKDIQHNDWFINYISQRAYHLKAHSFVSFWLKCASYETLKNVGVRDLIELKEIWKEALENDVMLKALLLSESFFWYIFCEPVGYDDLTTELFDAIESDDDCYESYETNSLLTILFGKAKEILNKNEQRMLMENLHRNFQQNRFRILLWKKFSKFFLNLRWTVHNEMYSLADYSDYDSAARNTMPRYYFSRLLNTGYNHSLVCILEWIDETFQSKEEKLKWFDEMKQSVPLLLEMEELRNVMNIVGKYVEEVQFLSNVLRYAVFSHKDETDIVPMNLVQFLRLISETLDADEFKQLMELSKPETLLSIDVPKLDDLVRKYTNETIFGVFDNHVHIRVWILLIITCSKEVAAEIVSFVIDHCSEVQKTELFGLFATRSFNEHCADVYAEVNII